MMKSRFSVLLAAARILSVFWMFATTSLLQAAEQMEYVPKLGEFPLPNVGHYFAGELVSVDHVNRRGAIRLMGDGVDDRYHHAPSHRFALLPYGTVRYHGAPAELRDVPIGTVLHGYFLPPPVGDTSLPPQDAVGKKYNPPYTHALTLEDDFSFYQRQGRIWKIKSIDGAKQKLVAAPIGKEAKDGLQGEQTFEFDAGTRVWKGRGYGKLEDLAAGQEVQFNFSWAPDWKNGQLYITDVWLDKESREVAGEVQRQVNIRHVRHRWFAGWIDHVEHQEIPGRGIVTLTLFAGCDPSLYDAVRALNKKGSGAVIAAGELTLRTWWQEHDNKGGPVVEVKEIPNPPPGSSGVQVKLQVYELLEGFRPGRIVRFRPNGFPNVKMPPEERVKSLDDR